MDANSTRSYGQGSWAVEMAEQIIPNLWFATLGTSLWALVNTGLQHLSVYGLTVEEKTPLAELVDKGKLQLPDEDTQLAMYELVQEYLAAQGLHRYEISNYAAAGQESRHNLVYWQYLPYLSFGSAACSFERRQAFLHQRLPFWTILIARSCRPDKAFTPHPA